MKLLRTIVSTASILLVLLSSSSFSVGLHYCGGRLNDVAFLEQADGCGHAKMPPCHRKMMEGCCDDQLIAHEGQGFKADMVKIAIEAPFIADILHNTAPIAEIIPASEQSRVQHLNYDPPLRSVDRTTLLQIFLI